MIWTTDMDAMLVAGREAGLSSFEIAARIGSPITASAVRSRRVDLGLPPRDTATLVLAGQFKSAYRQPVKAAPQVVDRPGPQSDPKTATECGPAAARCGRARRALTADSTWT
jgi:hypothetical protein